MIPIPCIFVHHFAQHSASNHLRQRGRRRGARRGRRPTRQGALIRCQVGAERVRLGPQPRRLPRHPHPVLLELLQVLAALLQQRRLADLQVGVLPQRRDEGAHLLEAVLERPAPTLLRVRVHLAAVGEGRAVGH